MKLFPSLNKCVTSDGICGPVSCQISNDTSQNQTSIHSTKQIKTFEIQRVDKCVEERETNITLNIYKFQDSKKSIEK